jgi:hypothetical protein
MHILNLLLAFSIPYFSIFQKIAPEGLVPLYFNSREAAFVGCEFFSLSFFWWGFLRAKVDGHQWSDPKYFAWLGIFIFLIFVSKFVMLLSVVWFCALTGFGLGWLSVSYGQQYSKYSITFLVIFSGAVIAFAAFILIGMAWFDFSSTDYYFYKNYLPEYVKLYALILKDLFFSAIELIKN